MSAERVKPGANAESHPASTIGRDGPAVPMTAKQVARQAGMTEHTVRYYVRIGLIRPQQDHFNRYYRYSAQDLRTLKFVRRAQSMGFTLAEIAQILDTSRQDEKATHQPLVRLVNRRLEHFTRDVAELLAARRRVKRLVQQWEQDLAGAPRTEDVAALIDTIAT